ncbi:recombinase family protein [bacterium]|nr:recombinase family protein [bacterium]
MGEKLGYVRVSSVAQNTERQLEGVELDRTFIDKLSGKDTNRPQLQELLTYARRGDTVYVHSLDRLGRNLDDLRNLVNQMTAKGITVTFCKENLTFADDKKNPLQELMFNIMAAFAQFERELVRERQKEGVQIAKANGAYKGRKQEMTPDRVEEIRSRVAAGEPKAKIAKSLGISRDTLYRYL